MDPGPTGSPEQKLGRLEEALWVSEAQAGDADAFVRLLNRHERPLLYYLRRLVPNADDALDLHQEVWLEAFRGLKSLQIPEAFRAWLYRIAHHKAARFVRNEIRQEQVTASLVDTWSEPAAADGDIALGAEALHKALEILPPHHREILVLHYLRDLSTHEVAAVLDCLPGTVKSRLYHARIALRNIVERKRL
ncbi:MAG TPA: RNA polymerase sigma factor [Candidatus Binatia bacterium]|jgi:RNA polymerase sigma-70 factor (ECF subfamily)|nr:RNA polymerase sigma factor [Candidatus Binatia bacterium]